MLSRLITKYGLATHLALLASLPLALYPFLSEQNLSRVLFWLTGFAITWILAEPSLRTGEHLSLARARVRSSILHDQMAWFFFVMLFCVVVRFCNSGIGLNYNVEQSLWVVSKPSLVAFPASAGDAGELPMAVAIAVAVVVIGLRHAIGLTARISFALTASVIVGLGGFVASICASAGLTAFVDALSVDYMKGPFWGLFFGAWLIVALSAGVQAEARKWGMSRIPFCLAVGGNACGLVLFSPSLYASVCLGCAAIFGFFCLIWLRRVGSNGAVARSFILMALGFCMPFFFLVLLLPESVRAMKIQSLDTAMAFSESYVQISEALSRISREMWMKSPWNGVGLGAFRLQVPFFAEKADWSILNVEPQWALNGYWTLLAERGILGCLLMAIGLGFLLFTWIQRLTFAVSYLRNNAEADRFLFACPPVVWSVFFVLGPLFAVSVFVPVFKLVPIVLVFAAQLPLAAASFPKMPTSQAASSPQKDS